MISIIIPAYNASKTIICTLDSIIHQTYKDFEVVVVNDGSTDDTAIVVQEYALIHPQIKLVSKENGGASSARNLGIDKALGDFVAFCDSDDIVEKNWLSSFAESEPADLISQGYKNGSSKDIKIPPKYYKGVEELEEWIIDAYDSFLWGFLWCKMFRMDIIRNNNVRFDTNLSFQEDLVFILNYLQYAGTINQLAICEYNYIDQGITQDKYKTHPKFYSSETCIKYLRNIFCNDCLIKLHKIENYFQRLMMQDMILDYQINRNAELRMQKYSVFRSVFYNKIEFSNSFGITRNLFRLYVKLPFCVYDKLMIITFFFIK